MHELDLKLLKTGDETALRQLFDELHPYLRRVAKMYSLRYDLSTYDTEDLVHETMIKIYQNIDKVRTDSKEQLFAWCKRVAKNVAIDSYRQSRRRSLECRTFEEESPLSVDATGPSNYGALLEYLLSELSEEEGELVRKRLSGTSMADIAKELDMPERTVYTKYHRVINKLRKRASSYLDK
jgi:RNA polymerase sigma-70 factor, ECF subfamily